MRVKCITNNLKGLTRGEDYTVIKFKVGAFKMLNDFGRFDWYSTKNFVEVKG